MLDSKQNITFSFLKKKLNYFNKYYYADLEKLIESLTPFSKKIQYLNSEKSLDGKINKSFDYYVMVNLIGDLNDTLQFLQKLRRVCRSDSKIIITYYNFLWEPILHIAEIMGFKTRKKEQNWLSIEDIGNLLHLADFEVVKRGERFIFPIYIPYLSDFLNKYVANLPFIKNLNLTNYVIARPVLVQKPVRKSVSVVVAARNEEKNIRNLVRNLPKMGTKTELVLVEGHSKDNTWNEINKIKTKKFKVRAYQQKGIGKADAVRLGIKKATGEIIIILDADLTVDPKDMSKFYDALSSGKGQFINGSRLVYPLEKDSMRFLNKIGNKFFSLLFTWILNTRFTDTLCGTKAFYKKDYYKFTKLRQIFGDFDPFGDFELIFGASKLNLKVCEIPVRYKARVYGSTNISRFKHGLMLFKMSWFALKKFKLE